MGKPRESRLEPKREAGVARSGYWRRRARGFVLTVLPFVLASAALVLAGPRNLVCPIFRPCGDFFMELREEKAAKGETLVLMLSGNSRELWGSWEEFPGGRVGLLSGRALPDGTFSLIFMGNFRRKAEMSGGFFWFRSGFAGEMTMRNPSPGDSPFVAARAGPVSFRRDTSGSAQLRSVSVDFAGRYLRRTEAGDDEAFSLAGLEIARPRRAGLEYARAVRYGNSVGAYARMKFADTVGNARTGIRRFEERTSSLALAGSLFSTVTVRDIKTASAKPVSTARYQVFSVGDGTGRGLGDFFLPGWESRVSSLLTERAREEAGLLPGHSLREMGFFGDELPAGGDFFICLSGVGFGYDRYKLAPYAAGDYRFVLPWKELGELLLPGVKEHYGLEESVR